MKYPLEVYKIGEYRVLWGPEEHAQAKKEGWLDERPMQTVENGQERSETVNDQPKRRGRPPRVQSISEVA